MLVTAQARGAHPMLALNLFRSRTFTVVIVVGFTFMACYHGLPFVLSLDLQQVKGLTALAVAVFGALLGRPDAFTAGMRASLLIAAGLALATASITAVFLTRSSRPQLSGIR